MTSPDWKGPGWYRVTGAAGTRILEEVSGPIGDCGTAVPGWIKGAHPSTPGAQAVLTVCFEFSSDNPCLMSVNTTVINCGDYYLYDLPQTPDCPLRYCGSQV